MSLDWQSGPLAEGLRCYRNQEFWLAHEHWESVWLRLEDPEKNFLQALIQTTAAFHHFQERNDRGTASLLRKVLRRLEPYPAHFGGINLQQLREDVREWLQAMENQAAERPENFPRIGPPRVSLS